MKKLIVFGLLLFCAAFVYAQQAMVLDDAIIDSVDFFSSSLKSGSTVAITNFEAEKKELSEFIIQELSVAFANTGKVRVVERSRLEMLQSELNFNMSGSVSDETAQGIGRMIGAQILFSGSISEYRDMYRMRIQAIVVETAEVIGTRTINIKYDPTLTGLLGKINPADAWKYQWLYAGFNVGYSVQLNRDAMLKTGYEYYLDIPLAFSIYAMIHPFDLFGIALDFGGDGFAGPNISILPTLTIRPSSFEIDLFLGVGINVFDGTIAFLGGGRAGHKAGPGVLYAEIRPIGWIHEGIIPFHINLTLGYQIGFINRKK
ncbi:MAG: penicillin-binding protein activator LpoB [Treponema sp.]|jgi:hypothetical protein|nr:penicillin-binding protein activator LpoB [Treponema sp.]